MKYMLKFSSLTALLLAIVSGAVLFWVSQQVQQVEREQRQLLASISQEEETMRVLRAEWDYLNRPERLEALSSKYLNMAPVSADTMVQSISAIPEPEEVTAPPSEQPLEISTGQKVAVPSHKPAVSMPAPTLNQHEVAQEPDFEKVIEDTATSTEGGQ